MPHQFADSQAAEASARKLESDAERMNSAMSRIRNLQDKQPSQV
eukprot:CAMPEP_0185622580 /NCGR_PEP_ID=MMETSP0436-20130131/59319_1 /TAXON_ID=626734 ORGANISM="Favella taraikaensis, Strain Fe Narragansett Bay" /NCGR_SAMPLE_ID=MMETSP0436 /ASSEMBLY_ACC=CAM_ASM_000390 /LENGTH=43 /DNA_ID= /DNA_START= /DNA_END= /DNA_ORIENTATION=